ncbi:hypothetical protein D3C85_1929220 [compost metagenome]
MTEDELRLHATEHIGQAKQRFLVRTHRIIANVKELDTGPQNIGGGLRLFATCAFD